MKYYIGTLFALLFLSSCASYRTFSDYDEGADFSKIKTFTWAEPNKSEKSHPLIANDLIDRRIKNAVIRELKARNMQYVEEGEADVYLTYNIVLEDKVTVDTYDPYWGYSWYYRGYGLPTTTVTEYTEGTLILGIHEQPTNELIWQGWAVGTVREGGATEERINEVVASIMNKYPIEE